MDYCSISLVFQWSFLHWFGIDFEGWSLGLLRYFAYALQHSRQSCQGSADNFPGRCALHYYHSVPLATAVLMRGRYQKTVAQTAVGWLDVRGSGCVPQLLRAPVG